MTPNVEQLKTMTNGLSSEERAELASYLIDSLEHWGPEADAAWRAEIARRLEEMQSGKVPGRLVEEFQAELRERRS